MSESYISVVTGEEISCGTLFGPLPLTSDSPDSLAVLTWRCVDKLSTSTHILKVSLSEENKSSNPSWLSHILPARNPEEQSLEIVAKGGQLYFRSLRDIGPGQELRAWFGQDLVDILKLPMIPPNTVEGEKRFECMLCQERFENPFPVVSHLMYRCKRKDHSLVSPRKKNGGRVKNFDIATLTDMEESVPQQRTLLSEDSREICVDGIEESQKENSKKRKTDDSENSMGSPKKSRLSEECENNPSHPAEASAHNGVFKLSTSSNELAFHPPIYSSVDLTPSDTNGTSAFKKVDKSNSSLHSISFSNLFSGSMDPRELLFHTSGNNFSPFRYPLTPVTSSPSYGGMSHSRFSNPPLDNHVTSAFGPSSKTSSTIGNIHQQLKMAEELRKIPNISDSGYELMMSPPVSDLRSSSMTLQYAQKPRPADGFGGVKTFPSPLLPFLPPSLAALSFPTTNWCAKCNASFRMTSDLVYHMRSHHKRETDPQKLKREEKLRCNICNESFRERHHLTRHMTSHQ